MAPLSSMFFNIRERLVGSIPISGPNAVDGVPFSASMFKRTNAVAISREKNPDDGRSVIIKLTPYGKEMRSISKGHVYQFNNKVREHITEEELESFFKVTSTINKLIATKKVFEDLNLKAI